MSVFKYQDALLIRLNTGYDLSSVSSVKILYEKPDGTRGEWVAVKNGTYVEYEIPDQNTLDQEGTWKLQSLLIFGDGAQAPGEITSTQIKDSLIVI